MSGVKETVFIFMRHGQTDQNVDMATGRAINEDSDYSLNKEGIKQAQEARDRLPRVDVIVASPMKRAQMMAEIVNENQKVPIVIEPDLRERSVGGVDSKTWHELFDIDKNVQPEKEGTENVRNFFERIYAVIDDLKERYVGKTVLIVSHGGVYSAFHAYFNNLPWKGNMRVKPLKNAETATYKMNNQKEVK